MQQLAKLETGSLKSGNKEEVELFEALQSPRLKELDTLQPISDTLKYIIVLVGIRADNMPTAIEKQILLEFLKEEFPNMTTGEILQAFKMFASGKLEQYLKKDFGHFQNLSAMFVSEVIKAYLKYINERRIKVNLLAKIEEEKKQEPTQKEKDKMNHEAIKKTLATSFGDFLEGKETYLLPLVDTHLMFVIKIGLNKVTDDEADQFKIHAENTAITQLETAAKKKGESVKKSVLDAIPKRNTTVNGYARLCLNKCFKVWKENGATVEKLTSHMNKPEFN
jgi:cytidine deaminase